MSQRVPTRKEFEEMAARGRLHTEDDRFIPSNSDLDEAQSPVDLGRLYGFTEDDIAHFYNFRRRGHHIAYTEYVRDLELAKVPPAAPSGTSPDLPTSLKTLRRGR
jgi:hypothetical protein